MNPIANTYTYVSRFVKREVNYHLTNPTNMLLFLTYKCTSQCKSCTMWQRKVTEKEMTLEEWKRFVDSVTGAYRIRNVELFGGDVFLRPDVLYPLIEHMKKRGITEIDMPTNCNLLDRKAADSLIRAGVDVLYTSIDGVGELHDTIRGTPGGFEKIKRNISYLAEARKGRGVPKIVINCTVSALNVHGFEKVLDFCREVGADKVAMEYVGEFPLESIKTSRVGGVDPDPYYTPQASSILLNREQAVYFKKKLRELKDTAARMNVRMTTGNVDILTLDNLVSGTIPNRKCYVSRYLIIADPYGNVVPCPFYKNYHLGNIRQQYIGEMWNTRAHREFMKHAGEKKNDLCRYCILGAERNPTFLQSLTKAYFGWVRGGYGQ